MTNLKDKAIDIKGKEYILVKDRILAFNELFPTGSITTELVSSVDAQMVVVKATVKPDEKRAFTGYSQATWGEGYINKTSALENAETSAVGRALAMMGIGVIDSIASVDEIKKANNEELASNYDVITATDLTKKIMESETDPVKKEKQQKLLDSIKTMNKLQVKAIIASARERLASNRVDEVAEGVS